MKDRNYWDGENDPITMKQLAAGCAIIVVFLVVLLSPILIATLFIISSHV